MSFTAEVEELLRRSPEEYAHAHTTLNHLLKIKPDSDPYLATAALSHDIERAVAPWQVSPEIHTEGFRRQHATRSVEIVVPLMRKHFYFESEIRKVARLILVHEWGGNSDENAVRDADSLANFEWCDAMYGRRDKRELRMTAERMYKRMAPEHRRYFLEIPFKNQEVRGWLMQAADSTF